MPRLDKDLLNAGYVAVYPRNLYRSAAKRKPGYLEYFTSKALLVDGNFYISTEDFDDIRRRYALDNARIPRGRRRSPSGTRGDIAQFLDPSQPVPRLDWSDLRDEYVQELLAKKSVGCNKYEESALRNKYRKILTKLEEEENAHE